MTDKQEKTTTISVDLSKASLEELVQINQGMGHDIDRLREKRAYVKRKIDAIVIGRNIKYAEARVMELEPHRGKPEFAEMIAKADAELATQQRLLAELGQATES